jgi:hypothetical protein
VPFLCIFLSITKPVVCNFLAIVSHVTVFLFWLVRNIWQVSLYLFSLLILLFSFCTSVPSRQVKNVRKYCYWQTAVNENFGCTINIVASTCCCRWHDSWPSSQIQVISVGCLRRRVLEASTSFWIVAQGTCDFCSVVERCRTLQNNYKIYRVILC